MRIKEVTYDQLIQVRQYEPLRISVTAIVNEGENPEEVLAEAKHFVQSQLRKAYEDAQQKKSVPANAEPVGSKSQTAQAATKLPENKTPVAAQQKVAETPKTDNLEVPNF
jgi:hypothetical protein